MLERAAISPARMTTTSRRKGTESVMACITNLQLGGMLSPTDAVVAVEPGAMVVVVVPGPGVEGSVVGLGGFGAVVEVTNSAA